MTQANQVEHVEWLTAKAALTADETGAVEGTAWDFATPDRTGDEITPEAFAGAIGKSLPMLFAHDQGQVVGAWDNLAVEKDGLRIRGKLLVNDVARAREVRALLQAKAVTGLSVGFVTKKAAPRKGGGRTISDLDLVEVSLVAVPAHDGARITSSKDYSMTNSNTAEKPAEGKTEEKAEDKVENKAAATDTKALDAAVKRIDALEAAANRLEAANDNKQADDVEAKALNSWLRTGQVEDEVKSLTVGTPADGGYTVAPEYSTNVITKITEMSPMRRLANVMSIGTSKVYIPTLETDAEGGWVTETGNRSEDQPTFGQVDIEAYEHAVIVPVSRQLLEDSMIDLQAFLAGRIATAFAKAEATAFLVGDGSGKPTGIADDVSVFDGVSAGSDILEDLIDTFYTLPSEYAQRGAWLMNRKTMGEIRKAADASTTRGTVWSDSLAEGQPARLLGAPVYEAALDDYGASTATGAVALFGDYGSAYQVVDRIGLQIMRDDYTGAGNGVVKFHARRRVGGKLTLAEPVVALKG